MNRRRVITAAVLDVASIVLFVVIGRKNHHEDGSFLSATARVAAPFLIALVVGWVGARAWRAPSAAVPTGVTLWLSTIVGGMLLRRFAFDDGTATPFIIVASVFTGGFLVGWRVVAERLGAKRAQRP